MFPAFFTNYIMAMELFFENLIKIEESYIKRSELLNKHSGAYYMTLRNNIIEKGYVDIRKGDDAEPQIVDAASIIDEVDHLPGSVSAEAVDKLGELLASIGVDTSNNEWKVWKGFCKANKGSGLEANSITAVQEGLTALASCKEDVYLNVKIKDTDNFLDYFDNQGLSKKVPITQETIDAVVNNKEWNNSILACSNYTIIKECMMHTRAATKDVHWIPVHEFLKPLGKHDFRFLFDDRSYGLSNKDNVQPADIFLIDRDHEEELYNALKYGEVPAAAYAENDESKLEKIYNRAGSFKKTEFDNFLNDDEHFTAVNGKAGTRKQRLKMLKMQLLTDDDNTAEDQLTKRKQSLIYNMNICTIMGWILPISLKKVPKGPAHVKFSELKIYDKLAHYTSHVAGVYAGEFSDKTTIDDLYLVKARPGKEKDGNVSYSRVRPFFTLTEAGFHDLQINKDSLPKVDGIPGIRLKVSSSSVKADGTQGDGQLELEVGDKGFGGKCGEAMSALEALTEDVDGGNLIKVFDENNQLTQEYLDYVDSPNAKYIFNCVIRLVSAFKKGLDKGLKKRMMFTLFITKCLKYKCFVSDKSQTTPEDLALISSVNDAICNYFKVA